ncbi:hypothetical protein ACLOJK_024650 [Asimina triloba]
MIGLIIFMIVGSVSGFVFFSYKIGIEGKDAVISFKEHLQESNYWIDKNRVPELVDMYTGQFYKSVSHYVDSLAQYYNVTDIVDGLRHYLVAPLLQSFSPASNAKDNDTTDQPQVLRHRTLPQKVKHLWLHVQNGEWKAIYAELGSVFRQFISVVKEEDLVEKMRAFVWQSVDVSKQVFASGTMVLAGSANFFLTVSLSIYLGAAGLLNFISQLMVFFWLLYYPITADSGGVMDHVLGMLPLSKSTRIRCANVLDHAVSSVLLAIAVNDFRLMTNFGGYILAQQDPTGGVRGLGREGSRRLRLERDYVEHHWTQMGRRAWCMGPLSFCNGSATNMAERGKKASIDPANCLKWLDTKRQGSVEFVCLGSMGRFQASQLLKIALVLKESDYPFLGVVGNSNSI